MTRFRFTPVDVGQDATIAELASLLWERFDIESIIKKYTYTGHPGYIFTGDDDRDSPVFYAFFDDFDGHAGPAWAGETGCHWDFTHLFFLTPLPFIEGLYNIFVTGGLRDGGLDPEEASSLEECFRSRFQGDAPVVHCLTIAEYEMDDEGVMRYGPFNIENTKAISDWFTQTGKDDLMLVFAPERRELVVIAVRD